MKRYLKTYFITFVLAFILSFLSSSFILFEEACNFDSSLSMNIAFVLSFGYVIFLLFKENKIVEKYQLKSLSYNICLIVNMIITYFLIYIIAILLFDNGYIYYCEVDCDWNGIQLIFIFIYSFINILSYFVFRLIRLLIEKYKKVKKILLIILSVIFFIIFVISIIWMLSEFGIIL